uniref:Peptidase_M28 domain-containing protein n=1 Tax=Meloidogyne hapla TaxID=6305 RepID=A0A1I8C1W8_MELHA
MLRSQNSQLVRSPTNQNNDLNSLADSELNSSRPWHNKISVLHKCLLIMAVCFGALMVVAMVADNKEHIELVKVYNGGFTEDDIRKLLFSSFDSSKMASTLRMVTQEPHQAGTDENRRVGQKLAELWKQNGLEKVRLMEYDVLLSYPNWTNPNKVTILGDDGKVMFQSTGLSPDLTPKNEKSNPDSYRAAIQWLAYSANGTVENEPVYCHYGQPKDLERLEKEFGILSLHGKIAIIRYGLDYRGDKVKHAAARGAGAVIIFSDPVEVAGQGPDAVFPQTDLLPPNGVQRGSILEGDGDVLSGLLPARNDFQRIMSIEQAKKDHYLPSIPVLPLGYADVIQILQRMGGPEVPADWRGGLNITYRIGPGFKTEKNNVKKLRVDVHSTLEIKKIQNLIGIIRGSEEPDSWVMLGNHYDAWVYGALDPNSGTAILAEVGRAFAQAVKHGWRPKRTLVFCNWDGEEHGLIGSTEFVQEFAQVLQDRAIIYLNVDTVASNQSLVVRTIPSLFSAVTAAAKQVPNPVASERSKGRQTVYDTWNAYYPQKRNSTWLSPDVPDMDLPGGGTDHMSFLNFLGIPVVDFTYRNVSWGSYPLYHSRYEVPFVNEHLFDHDNLSVHKAIGQYWAEMARSFADSPLLPINASCFALTLSKNYLPGIVKKLDILHSKWPKEMGPAIKQMRNLWKQTWLFVGQTQKFEQDVYSEVDMNAEWANRRLRKVDQCFVNPAMGLAAKEKEKRHVLFSLSDADTYSASVMSAVNDKMIEFEHASDDKKRLELGQQLSVELAVVQYSVLCATNILKPFY